jgi:hypothetical protein
MNSQSRSVGQSKIGLSTDHPTRVFAVRDERMFPGPWSVDQIPQGYRVLDANHRVLAYVVTSDESMKDQSSGLTFEEARRIARVFSSLPDLITGPPTGRAKRSWWK